MGQETPVVLLKTIERVGTANPGINLDPANLGMLINLSPDRDPLRVISRILACALQPLISTIFNL